MANDKTIFNSGAVRDTSVGKSAMELIPFELLPEKINENLLMENNLTANDKNRILKEIFQNLAKLRVGDTSVVDDLIVLSFDLIGKKYLSILYELGIHYGAGAEKYGANNYMLGQKLSHIVGSYTRHLTKYIQEWKDEAPHERGMLWNVLNIKFVIMYYKNDKDICDMLYWYQNGIPNKEFIRDTSKVAD